MPGPKSSLFLSEALQALREAGLPTTDPEGDALERDIARRKANGGEILPSEQCMLNDENLKPADFLDIRNLQTGESVGKVYSNGNNYALVALDDPGATLKLIQNRVFACDSMGREYTAPIGLGIEQPDIPETRGEFGFIQFYLPKGYNKTIDFTEYQHFNAPREEEPTQACYMTRILTKGGAPEFLIGDQTNNLLFQGSSQGAITIAGSAEVINRLAPAYPDMMGGRAPEWMDPDYARWKLPEGDAYDPMQKTYVHIAPRGFDVSVKVIERQGANGSVLAHGTMPLWTEKNYSGETAYNNKEITGGIRALARNTAERAQRATQTAAGPSR